MMGMHKSASGAKEQRCSTAWPLHVGVSIQMLKSMLQRGTVSFKCIRITF